MRQKRWEKSLKLVLLLSWNRSKTSLVSFQARLVKSSDDYRSFFVQRDLLCLLNQVSRRCLHLLPTDHLEVQQVSCLIETIGALVKLLVLLENREDLTTRVTKHYSVKTDVTPSEILERCLRVLSDVVLEESVEKQSVGVKHCQSIVNRLFSAATSTSRCCEENSTTDFSVDFFEQTVIFASSSLDQVFISLKNFASIIKGISSINIMGFLCY